MLLVLQILIFVIVLISVFLLPAGVPGNFIATGIVLLYWIFDKNNTFSFWYPLIFFILSVSAEVVESFIGVWGAKKYGATKWGMVASFFGGIIGAILGTSILPVVGTLLGVFVGGFFLTFLVEYLFAKRTFLEGAKAGWGVVLAKIFSVIYKYIVGDLLIVTIAWKFWA